MSALHHQDTEICAPIHVCAISRRERRTVALCAWIVAILLHIAAFWAAARIIDWRIAVFDVEMNWSSAPLNGFGMMAENIDSGADETYEPPPPVEADENPYQQDADTFEEPAIDPDDIQILQENQEHAIDESKPPYDLSRDKQKLNAVKKDIASLPNLRILAPGNARLIVLIRNDRVSGSRFENSVRRLMRAFPDYRFALGASDIDPIRDVQALLIATANPKLYAETFLAVSHKIPENRLKRAIAQSFPTRLNWRLHNGRPLAIPDENDGKYNKNSGIYKRALFLANGHTVLFLKPELLSTLDAARVDDIVGARDDALERDAGAKATFLQSLGNIAQQDSLSVPTLFFMVQGIEGIRLGRGFPEFVPPNAMIASLSTAERPHLNLSATFASAEDAENFAEQWPEIVRAASNMGIPGVGALIGALQIAHEKNDKNMLVSGDLNGAMIGLVLLFAANYLERNQN